MVEAVMLWNEPNNLSHWNHEVDPDWQIFSRMVVEAAQAVKAEQCGLKRALGGISPIDPGFVQTLQRHGVLGHVDVFAIHGFPLDWNHWCIDEWPQKVSEMRLLTELPLWVSEAGASSFGAEEVQVFGLQRTAELLCDEVERIHWYSLYDLPKSWPATTRHREAEGSSYYRHFYMGLVKEDGQPKQALKEFSRLAPAIGLCQWFHFEDHRLNHAVSLMKDLGVKYLRTGLSWADSLRPEAEKWFDEQMRKLEPFEVTVTYCFTPEPLGILPHHTSPPKATSEFADFCARMTRRYCH